MLPVVLLAVVIVVVFSVLMGLYFRPTLKMTSAVRGRVVRVTKEEVRDPDERFERWAVTIEFTAGGITREFVKTYRDRLPRTFTPGESIDVRYNPGDPTMADLAPAA